MFQSQLLSLVHIFFLLSNSKSQSNSELQAKQTRSKLCFSLSQQEQEQQEPVGESSKLKMSQIVEKVP